MADNDVLLTVAWVAARLAASVVLPVALAQLPEETAREQKKPPAATLSASTSPAVLSSISATVPIVRTKVNAKDGLTYVLVSPGKFIIGCSAGDAECFSDEKKSHEVTITSGFWIGQTDVTQEAYNHVIGRNPSHFKGASLPVETVSWAEAQTFCRAVGARLPSEAEWEYAARGGNPSSRYGRLGEIAWYGSNSGRKTHAVARKKANPYGLYDMLGNVWQWTADWYADYASTPVSDPSGPDSGTGRTLRGGSWGDYSRFVRDSDREGALPGDRYDVVGFRCAMGATLVVADDQTFPASGGSESTHLPFIMNLPWEASSSADWVTFTGPVSGAGSGTISYTVAPNTGVGRSATVKAGDTSFSVEQEPAALPELPFAGSVTHAAAGENWTTTFTLVNKGATAAQARVSLFGDSGSPLKVPLSFPQQSTRRGALAGASLDRTLAPNASLIVETAARLSTPLQIGSARLAATGAVDGFAIFHLIPGAQEAVVPLETRNAKSYLLPFDNTGGVGLSVAVANVSPQPSNVGVMIRDDTGARLGSGSLALAGSGHASFALAAQYPETANTRGTIEFTTPADGHISVLGIRTTPLGTTTTLAAIPALADIGTGGGAIPQIATGNGWQTTFVLINTGNSVARADLSFFDDSGSPLSLPIEFPQSGGGAASVVSSINRTLAAGATLLVRSAAPLTDPAPRIGSAQFSTDGKVGGFVIFRHNPSGQEAVVPVENRNANAYLLAFDNTNGTVTSVAVDIVSTQPADIPVVLRDDTGGQIGTGSLALAANGHHAFILATQFPAAAGIRGTVEFDAPAGERIGVLGIRTLIGHAFTTLPVLVK